MPSSFYRFKVTVSGVCAVGLSQVWYLRRPTVRRRLEVAASSASAALCALRREAECICHSDEAIQRDFRRFSVVRGGVANVADPDAAPDGGDYVDEGEGALAAPGNSAGRRALPVAPAGVIMALAGQATAPERRAFGLIPGAGALSWEAWCGGFDGCCWRWVWGSGRWPCSQSAAGPGRT